MWNFFFLLLVVVILFVHSTGQSHPHVLEVKGSLVVSAPEDKLDFSHED